MKKKILIPTIVCIILLTASIAFNWTFLTSLDQANRKIERANVNSIYLVAEIEALMSEIEDLKTQILGLRTEKRDLGYDLLNLETEMLVEVARLNDIIETQKDDAYKNINNLENQITNLNNQITNLNHQIDDLRAAKLVNVGVGAYDNRVYEGNYNLHVYGWVFNVGYDTIESSRMHVTAYYTNGTLAIDTYINVGEVRGCTSKEINAYIKYEGPTLEMSRITTIPEYP